MSAKPTFSLSDLQKGAKGLHHTEPRAAGAGSKDSKDSKDGSNEDARQALEELYEKYNGDLDLM